MPQQNIDRSPQSIEAATTNTSTLICVSQFVPIVRKKDSQNENFLLFVRHNRFPFGTISSHRIGISDLVFHSLCLFVSGLFLFFVSLLGPLPPRWMDMASFFRIPFLHSTLRALSFSEPKVHIDGWKRMGGMERTWKDG